MRTVVIRVDEPADPSDTNAGFPAHLMVDDGTPDWRQRHQASAEIRRFPQTAPGATARFADIAAIHRALVDPSGEGLPYLGQLGIDLYDLLFVEPIASAWVEQLQSAGADGLRTVLDFRPSSMQALPWELMSHNHRPLFLDPDRPFVRAMRPDPTAVPVAGADDELGPIRLLVVVGDPNDNRIANEEELDGIHRGLRALHGRVHVEVAYGSSWRDFVQLINVGVRPHILHFVGHATLDPGNAGSRARNPRYDKRRTLAADG